MPFCPKCHKLIVSKEESVKRCSIDVHRSCFCEYKNRKASQVARQKSPCSLAGSRNHKWFANG